MSRRYARSLIAVPAAALAAALGATAALAATTWTVRPGGPVSMISTNLLFRDTKTRSTIMCTSTTFGGSLKRGSGLSGTQIGSLTAISFSNCTNPLGARVRFQLTPADLPWHVNVTAFNATNGMVTGNIRSIQIMVLAPGCTTVIDGTSATASDGVVRFGYTNATAKLTARTGGHLHFYSVMGCAGLWNTGDPIKLTATFTVNPKQTITSP